MGLFKPLKGNGPSHVGADSRTEGCEPPPGPPPSHRAKPDDREDYAPPPGPPPSDNPPPYHDWTVVPDTALLPPPPGFSHGHQASKNNATWDEAARAHAYCDHFPPYSPSQPSAAVYEAVNGGHTVLEKPREFVGELKQMDKMWRARTTRGCGDCVLISSLPLYFAAVDSPLHAERKKTVYFEVKVLNMGSDGRSEEAGIAVGYCAKPYPSWRLPGWERASLGVHGDDGRRFVNDSYGGKDFTKAFKPGETVGIGMAFTMPGQPANGTGHAHTEVFFTHNGQREGGWQVDEEVDQDDRSRGVDGLSGELDLYAAVGTFGECDFAVCFDPAKWLYQGAS